MADLETVRPPRINGALVTILQTALDERAVVAIAQPRSKGVMCASKERRGDHLVGCGALAAFHHLDEEECGECGKLKKSADEPYCLAHMALHLDGKLQSPQTAFHEVDPATHAAPAQRDHAADADEEDPEPEDDEVPEGGDDPDATTHVLDGTTGAPIAAETYAMTPDPQNEALCVCGFEIASDVAGTFHDARHEQYLASTGDAPIPKTVRKNVTRVGDVTKAVSARKKDAAKKKSPPKRARGAKR